MPRPLDLLLTLLASSIIYSCHRQVSITDCSEQLNKAKALVYGSYGRITALDSAQSMLKTSLKCDTTKKAAVELSIRIYITMEQFENCIKFIDSLNDDDFLFPYKKPVLLSVVKALESENSRDTVNSKKFYRDAVHELEVYLNSRPLSNEEFNEAYTELFVMKRKYLRHEEIKQEAKQLAEEHPEKARLFEVLGEE